MSITQIDLYENTVQRGLFVGRAVPSMTVRGDVPVEELEAQIVDAYIQVTGGPPEGLDALREIPDTGRYLTTTDARNLFTDFRIGMTYDGAVDLQTSGLGSNKQHLCDMVRILQEDNPEMTVNDGLGYLAKK